ncbi:MAG: LPS export ABC transporter protein LptC [Saprospiraceae bacterium]|jgi:LPS export ABC transporter protein LptC
MRNCTIAILFVSVCLVSCSNESSNLPTPTFNPDVEIAEGVEIISSDSAKLKYIIKAPRLETYYENDILVKRFPKGLRIELYDELQELSSTMCAKYAESRSSLGTLLLSDSVILTNAEHDELTTIGILWNETKQTLTTDKFVRLVKASSHDTLYGYGLEAKDDFSRMKIKDFAGKRRSESNDTP